LQVYEKLDDFVGTVGTHLGFSEWVKVEQPQIQAFADATGDQQWIHTDIERATAGPYGAPIAHGYLTLSLIPVLTASIFRIEGLAMGVNYGLNRVRFPSPLRSGSLVRAGAELVEVEKTAHGVMAVIRFTISADDDDRPACVADTVTLFA
jgi:acyl dehydratase